MKKEHLITVTLRYLTKGVRKMNQEAQRVNRTLDKQSLAMAEQNKTLLTAPKAHRDILKNAVARGKAVAKVDKISAENALLNNLAQSRYGKVMGMNMEDLKKYGGIAKKTKTRMGRLAFGIRKMTHGMRGFRMEMLGVMFFGMSLVRIFGGLMRTSTEWMGVTKVMSAALGILFLPLAKDLLNWALKFLKWVKKLTPEQKKTINNFVKWGAIIGIVLTVIGTLALGIGSLILVLGALSGPVGIVIAAIGGFAIFKFLTGYMKDFSSKTGETEKKLLAFGISADSITKIKDKMNEVLPKIKEFFGGLKEKIGTWMAELIPKIKEFFGGLKEKIGTWMAELIPKIIKSGGDLVFGLANGIIKNADKICDAIKELIDKIVNFISENIGKILDTGLKILQALIDGIVKNKDKIGEALEEVLSELGKWIGKNIPALVHLGAVMAKHIGKGLIKGVGGLFDALLSYIPGYSKASEWWEKHGTIRGYALGGIVPGPVGRPTLAVVHGGESITPPGKSGISPNITINATIASDYDVRRLADELKRYWTTDYERMSTGRGI